MRGIHTHPLRSMSVLVLAISILLSFGASMMQGQDAAVPEIPATLPTIVRDSLTIDRTELLASVNVHNKNVREWRASCGQVLSDSPFYAACHQVFQRLSAEAAAVVANKKLFAKRLEASIAAACAGDPGVASGCNIPSEKK